MTYDSFLIYGPPTTTSCFLSFDVCICSLQSGLLTEGGDGRGKIVHLLLQSLSFIELT